MTTLRKRFTATLQKSGDNKGAWTYVVRALADAVEISPPGGPDRRDALRDALPHLVELETRPDLKRASDLAS